jgi:hypothetical protein
MELTSPLAGIYGQETHERRNAMSDYWECSRESSPLTNSTFSRNGSPALLPQEHFVTRRKRHHTEAQNGSDELRRTIRDPHRRTLSAVCSIALFWAPHRTDEAADQNRTRQFYLAPIDTRQHGRSASASLRHQKTNPAPHPPARSAEPRQLRLA